MSTTSTQSNNDVLLGLLAEVTQQRDAARSEAAHYRKRLGIQSAIPVDVHVALVDSPRSIKSSSSTEDNVSKKAVTAEEKKAKKEAKKARKKAKEAARKEKAAEEAAAKKATMANEKQQIKDALAAAGIKKPSAFAPYQKWLKDHFTNSHRAANPEATAAEVRSDAKAAWASMSDDAKAPWQVEYKNALREYQTKKEAVCAQMVKEPIAANASGYSSGINV